MGCLSNSGWLLPAAEQVSDQKEGPMLELSPAVSRTQQHTHGGVELSQEHGSTPVGRAMCGVHALQKLSRHARG